MEQLYHSFSLSTLFKNFAKAFLSLGLLTSLAFIPVSFFQPGLNSPNQIGQYLNGNFPSAIQSELTLQTPFTQASFSAILATAAEPASTRIHFAERGGVFYWVSKDGNGSDKTLFMNISGRVWTGQDSGVLGMAFHPDYNKPGNPNRNYVYVYYVTSYGGDEYIRLSRFTRNEANNTLDANSESILFDQVLGPTLHRGGGLLFGNDGFLYLAIGDLGWTTQSQNITDRLSGGVLRIDVDKRGGNISHPVRRTLQSVGQGTTGDYYIPNDNPFLATNGSVFEEYYTLGCRNPHRMTIDRLTGNIYIGNVGSNSGDVREEVNRVAKGANFGWPYREGLTDRPDLMARPATIIGTETDPIHEYNHSGGNRWVVGGYVYRGTAIPDLYGKYIFADGASRKIWALDLTGSAPYTQKEEIVNSTSTFYSFAEDQDGELYLTSNSVQKLSSIGNSGANSIPQLLSQTGAFQNLSTLEPSAGIIPYDMITSLWSDGAEKYRWLAVPNDGSHNTAAENIVWSEEGEWGFPVGSVFIKHFEIQMDKRNANSVRRLETRFLIHGETGYYALTYRWRPDGSDAELLSTSFEDNLTIIESDGSSRQQTWYYPSRSECFVCHTEASGRVLGPKTRHLNRDILYPSTGLTGNQVETYNHLGMFDQNLNAGDISTYLSAKALDDQSASIDDRARSYLDVNCSSCHRPGAGTRATWNGLLSENLANAFIVNGEVAEDLGISGAKVVVPGDTAKSILYQRMKQVNTTAAMPPLAKSVRHDEGLALIAEWINTMDPDAGVSENGLLAIYYDNIDFTNEAFRRIDPEINFDWSTGTPSPSMDVNTFSIRWEGFVEAPTTGTYTFYTNSDDGVRLWVNGQMIIENWTVHPATENSGTINLVAGQRVPIRMDFFENGGHAVAQLRWSASGVSKQIIPQSALFTGETSNEIIAHWPLDDNANDIIGDADGTFQGGASLINDAGRGKVLSIANNGEHVLVTPKPQLQVGNNGQDFSIAFWMNLTQGSTGAWRSIMHKGEENYQRTFAMWMRPSDNRIHFRISTSANPNEGGDSQGAIPLNEWTHIAYVKEGQSLKLYINGEVDREITLAGTSISNNGNLYFGDTPWYAPALSSMDDIRLYGYALGESELAELSTPLDVEGSGLLATYYDNIDFTNEALQRVDPTINFNWGGGSPDASVGANTFSVRWEGEIKAPTSGTYTFYTMSDDGVRLWVNNQLVVQNWTDHGPTENTGTISMAAGERVPIRMEFYENGGGAVAQLRWSATGVAKQVIPAEYLYPVGWTPPEDPDPSSCTATGELLVERWNEVPKDYRDLTAIPDTTSPDISELYTEFLMPDYGSTKYGVRARGYLCAPMTGDYRFTIQTDNIVELWLSTDANPFRRQVIVYAEHGSHLLSNRASLTRTSSFVSLQQGKSYYIEARVRDRGGDEQTKIGWTLPNGSSQSVIPGEYLSPIDLSETDLPGIPENVSAELMSFNGIKVSWEAPADTIGIAGFHVFRNGDMSRPIAKILNGNTYLIQNDLPTEADYQFSVATVDVAGNLSPIATTNTLTLNRNCEERTLYLAEMEEGTGIWQITGSRSFVKINSPSATSGSNTLTVNGDYDDSNTTTVNLDLEAYDEVVVGFNFKIFEYWRADDYFRLQVSTDGGATFTTVREWRKDIDFRDLVPYSKKVRVKASFTNQTQFRITQSGRRTRGFGFLNLDDIYVSVCALDGCSGESNLASNRSARLSSQYGNGSGDLGTDGNYVGNSPWSADLVHTTNEAQPWWEVDLGARSQVDSLVIYNRTNGNQGRLKNFYILTSDAPMSGSLAELLVQPGLSSVYFAYKADSIQRIPVNAEGRYVRIQLSGNDILHFAEVEVIGCNLEQLCETPVVSIDPVSPLNEDGSPVQLSASPSGGVWSGAVDGSGVFDPSLGVGTYELIYSYEAFSGCEGSDTLEIEVLPSGSVCDAPANLASNGTTSQSSTYGNGVAGLAIDGNTTGSNAWSADLQHTTREAQPWWQIDLGQQSKLNEIVLYNRSDNSFNRLKAFYVLVSDVPMSASSSLDELLASSSVSQVYFPGVAGAVESIALDGLSGRYVRVQLSGSNILHMAEVEIMGCREDGGCIDPIVSIDPAGPFAADAGPQQLVASPVGGSWSGAVSSTGIFDPSQGIGSYEILYTYTDPNGCSASAVSTVEVIPGGCDATVNLALNKLAEQSSTYGNGNASIAVDGNSLGTSPWLADLAHTNNEAQPWWQVDLGAISNIQQVKIHNRTDCCQGRLKNFHILTSTEPFSSTASLDELLADPSVEDYFVAGAASVENTYNLIKEARYVRIQLSGSNILHIAEVEVLGCASENDPCFGEQAAQILGAEDQTIGFGSYQLTASPAGGSWSGDVTEAGLLLGTTCPGSYEAIYTYDNGQGCVSRDTATIVVKPEVMDVFIYAGQSNATGAQNTLDVLRVGDSPYDEKISYAWNIPGLATSNGWESLQAIEVDPATNRRGHGAEISFGRTLFEAGYNNIGIIKVARGGTNLANHWDPNTTLTGVSGNFGMYPEMLNTVNARLAELDAQGIPYRITGFLWHQGEGDMNPSMASIYGANLTELISALRSDFGQELKVFLASVYNPNATEEEGMLVRNAQRDVATADAQAYVVNLDTVYYDGDFNPNAENLIADNLHYNSIGQIKNGSSFANTLLTFHPVEGCEDENTGACASPENLALNQPTEQSSTYGLGTASLAVDGNRTGSSPWSADLQHTEVEAQPWWQVDLGAVSNIEQVNIYNRTDCCAGRLNNFYILVSDNPFDPTATLDELRNDPNNYVHTFTGRAGLLENITIGTTGRYVRIQHTRTIQLHLAEVEVMGCAIGTQGNRLANANEAEAGENIDFDLRIFPNPSSGRITISIDQLAQGEPVEYSLYNLQGQRVWQTRGQRTEQVNLSHLAKGVYLLKAQGADLNLVKQIMIH